MAAEKKSDKERSVEERLKALYQLQTILSEIDRIRFLRGELPNEVKDLEDEIIRYQTRIQKYSDEIVDLREIIATKKKGIEERRVKIARYDTQIDNVRNNREFAFLEKEKEFENLEIELAEKNIREALAKINTKEEEINKARTDLQNQEQSLEDKKRELDEIVSETRQEEEALRMRAKEPGGRHRPLHSGCIQAHTRQRTQWPRHRDGAAKGMRRMLQQDSASASPGNQDA